MTLVNYLRDWKNSSLGMWLWMVLFSIGIKILNGQPTSSTPIMTYQPPYIESNTFQYSNSTGTMLPSNTKSGGRYSGSLPISFTRIHLYQPFAYKATVSITGLGYVIQFYNISQTSNVYIQIVSQTPTSFSVEAYMQFFSKFILLNCRYLAYNPNYLVDDFYFDGLRILTLGTIDFTTRRIQTSYYPYTLPGTALPTDYKSIFLLQGIDTTLANQMYYIIFDASVGTFNSTHYKIDLTAEKCFLNEVRFTMLFYLTSLQYNAVPTYKHTKLLTVKAPSCGGYAKKCIIYDPATMSPQFNVHQDNFFIGIHSMGPLWNIYFDVYFNTSFIQSYIDSNNYQDPTALIFYGYTCVDGFYFDSITSSCFACPDKCLLCTGLLCFSCAVDYKISTDNKTCVSLYSPSIYFLSICTFYNNSGSLFTCIFCNMTKKLILNQSSSQCICRSGYSWNDTSQMCEDICGDSKIIDSQCDDGNTKSGDGCDSLCRIQPGFNCSVDVMPTFCKSLLQLRYKIEMIQKLQDQQAAGIIILTPTTYTLPFNVIKSNFLNQNQLVTFLDLRLVINSVPETNYKMNFQLQQVDNNKIYIYFTYDFTVENFNASIFLNYSQTMYALTNQTLYFNLTALNGKFQFTSYYQAYGNVSNGILVATLLGLLGLFAGLFLPKFIGLETIITLQLIFYSQILISKAQNWPVGFMYLKYLKIATGYNEFIFITSYLPLTNITKKFQMINLKKTIIENINLNFVAVFIFMIGFLIAVWKRSEMETEIESYIKVNKIKDVHTNPTVKEMTKKFNIPLKINQALYWVISQLCVWSILPIVSSIGCEFLIPNSLVSLNGSSLQTLFLQLRGIEFFILLLIVFSILLNHVKNAFLSRRTLRKIHQRPEELLYKKLLIIYLFIMGGVIFLLNDVQIGSMPISVIALGLHAIYAVSLLFIQPYKQSLRIHAFTLYMNQVLYGVFLVIINLINLVSLDEAIILYIGFAITGWVGFLIIMTFIRLYFQIRYGQALDKQIQQERRMEEQEEKQREKNRLNKKIDMLEKQAKQKLTKQQQRRDQNKFLIEIQSKQQEKQDLLEWLETKQWEKIQKQRFYFKKYHEKPLSWLKETNKTKYEERLAEVERRNKEIEQKRKRKNQDPQYLQITENLRNSLETKKNLLRSFKKDMRRKKQDNKWNYAN